MPRRTRSREFSRGLSNNNWPGWKLSLNMIKFLNLFVVRTVKYGWSAQNQRRRLELKLVSYNSVRMDRVKLMANRTKCSLKDRTSSRSYRSWCGPWSWLPSPSILRNARNKGRSKQPYYIRLTSTVMSLFWQAQFHVMASKQAIRKTTGMECYGELDNPIVPWIHPRFTGPHNCACVSFNLI